MPSGQVGFTGVDYGNGRWVSGREVFLEQVDVVIPWPRWVRLIESFALQLNTRRRKTLQ